MLFALLAISFTTFGQSDVQGSAAAKGVDVDNSIVTWEGKKVLGKHSGNIKIKSGTLLFENDLLVGGEIQIDMTTINTTDLEGEMAGKLNGHLASPDFFDVENNPTASFLISKVASKGTPGDYKLIGEMTIKGITNTEKLYVNLTDNNAKGSLTLDRTDYNVRYGSGSFFDKLGDNTIYDEFELSINLVY